MEEMVTFLAEFHGIGAELFREHLYHKKDREVAEHLFTVSASLDSMVLGETQILGQVRSAYDLSRELETVGPLLNPLFQRAIAVGKRVMSETTLAEGRLSIASVAVDYAKRIFETFTDKTVLCIGAGKMTTLALQSFAALNPRKLLVCNRDSSKAMPLASRFDGYAVPFDRLEDHLVEADIVVTSTGSAHPILTLNQFKQIRRRRRNRTLFVIDIAVPRDVEASVGDVENVYLYNLDDLQQVVQSTQAQRVGVIDAAKHIVATQVDEFAIWHRAREMGPVIDRLYRRYHRIAQEELSRTRGKLSGQLSEQDEAHLEDMVRRVVNKLLHNPIQVLRQGESAGAHTPPGGYLHAFEKLFHVGEHVENSPSPGVDEPTNAPSAKIDDETPR
jgi:glutamyl-tRNA reductase